MRLCIDVLFATWIKEKLWIHAGCNNKKSKTSKAIHNPPIMAMHEIGQTRTITFVFQNKTCDPFDK
jgi:hypothetical protein